MVLTRQLFLCLPNFDPTILCTFSQDFLCAWIISWLFKRFSVIHIWTVRVHEVEQNQLLIVQSHTVHWYYQSLWYRPQRWAYRQKTSQLRYRHSGTHTDPGTHPPIWIHKPIIFCRGHRNGWEDILYIYIFVYVYEMIYSPQSCVSPSTPLSHDN